jgi:hypothetical protein
VQPARQADQHRDLHGIKRQLAGRLRWRGQVLGREHRHQRDIEPGRCAHRRKARSQRQFELQPVMHEQHGRRLARDRHPAQADQRAQTRAPEGGANAAQRLVARRFRQRSGRKVCARGLILSGWFVHLHGS